MLKLSLATTLFLSVTGTIIDSPVTNPNTNPNISKKEKIEQYLALIQKVQNDIQNKERSGRVAPQNENQHNSKPFPKPTPQQPINT